MRTDQKHGPDIVEADQTGKAGKANGQGPPGSRAAPKETGAEGAVVVGGGGVGGGVGVGVGVGVGAGAGAGVGVGVVVVVVPRIWTKVRASTARKMPMGFDLAK